jgi:hypothetical protein
VVLREVLPEDIEAYLKRVHKGARQASGLVKSEFYAERTHVPERTHLHDSKERREEKKKEMVFGRSLHQLRWHKKEPPVNSIEPTLTLDAFPESKMTPRHRRDQEVNSGKLRKKQAAVAQEAD